VHRCLICSRHTSRVNHPESLPLVAVPLVEAVDTGGTPIAPPTIGPDVAAACTPTVEPETGELKDEQQLDKTDAEVDEDSG